MKENMKTSEFHHCVASVASPIVDMYLHDPWRKE